MSEIQKRNKRIAEIRKQLKATVREDKRYTKQESVKKAKLYKELKDLGAPSKFGDYWINTFLKPKDTNVQRKKDYEEDRIKRKQLRKDLMDYFARNPNFGPEKTRKSGRVPSLEKGKDFVTSAFRPSAKNLGHRKYGALDVAAARLGSKEEQQKFIDHFLKLGYRIIDETKAVSQKRGDFTRGIFHIDSHPTKKGVLQSEIPVKKEGGGSREFKTHGRYPVVKPGQMSEGGFTAPIIESPHKRETKQMSVPVEQTEEFKHFNRDLTDETKNAPPQETELPPAMEAQKQRQLSIEGSAIPFKNEDIELKKQEQMEEYVPSHTPMESLPEEMKVEESMEEKVSDPQDLIVDYKKRQAKKFNEGGSVLKEPELPEDPEEQKRAMGETDIISEAVEDKVEGTVPTPVDSWRLKPKEPVEVPDPEDLSKMEDSEISKKIRENMEVTSEPGSDIVRLQPKSGQGKRVKKLRSELQDRKIEDSLVKAGLRETETMVDKPEVKVDLKEKVTVEEPVEPKAFTLQDYIQQTLQRDEDARQILQTELAAAKEAENKIQKVEPYRFWNNMSTPAKIVAGIGMLISGYAAKDSPAGLQAVMNVIDGAVNADIQAQKLTQDQQLVVAKEATRRAQAAVNKYQALATSPTQKAKLMELAQALEAKRVGVEKKQQLMALRQYVMNKAREGKLHMVPPSLMRMVYPKEEMKRIDTMRNDYEKERKERKIQPILSAYRRMHRLIDTKEDVSGMDDIAIVFSFMKMLDPNSVVRETEFETAANAGPRAKYFARQWNRFITGGRFTQADRRGFLKSALSLVKPALDEEKQIQRKYVAMARRYGYPAAFIIPPSTRYFDLPGTKDEAAIRKIMKEQGKTRDEAESIHYHVAKKVKPRYVMRKGVKYPVK